ncbi:MAG: hypothetical protein ACK5N0_11210 [Synechococcaceae cyanobacterium]
MSPPATVPDEDGNRFRPIVALVVDASGAIRAAAPGHPNQPLEPLAKAITQARDHPQPPNVPGEPQRVVVAGAGLQKLVAKLLPGVLVSEGPTPHLARVAESLMESMAPKSAPRGLEARTTYLTEDLTPDDVRRFFEVAAALYDRQPWRRFPRDGHLFEVTCAPMGLHRLIGCVIGQYQESYGVLLFASVTDYQRYVIGVERVEAGEDGVLPLFPSYRAINFESKSDMPKGLLGEIEHYDWPVAGPDAYPTVMLVEPDLLLLPPRRVDIWRLELVALALCEWLDAEPQLASLWQQSPLPARRRFCVKRGESEWPVLIGVADGRLA